jgi:hypothetical protein
MALTAVILIHQVIGAMLLCCAVDTSDLFSSYPYISIQFFRLHLNQACITIYTMSMTASPLLS